MQIIVCDRETAERGVRVRSGYAVVSIRDAGRRPARVRRTSGLRAVLHLAFDDAEPTDGFRLPPGVRLMTRGQAEEVWRFVEQHRGEVGAFVVHCHQGASRSPAVAAALAARLGVDGRAFWTDYSPNRHVYNLLRDTMPPRPPDGAGAGTGDPAALALRPRSPGGAPG